MSAKSSEPISGFCAGCVYYPPNLPQHAYAAEDWAILQARACSFEHAPGSADCLSSRKTSCSLLDLSSTSATLKNPRTRAQ